MVSPTSEPGKYEIIAGQRRLLAHQKLNKDSIYAVVLGEQVDETTAKALSITENLIRRELSAADLIDACTYLYNKYGSVKAVVEKTGLPQPRVSSYVKFDRLVPELKELVKDGKVDVKVALRAQDAAEVGGTSSPAEAVKLAKEMATMSGVQQKRVVEDRQANPAASIDTVLESAKGGAKLTQILVTLGAGAHQALQAHAKNEQITMDDAARELIEGGLSAKGLMEG